MDLLLGSGVLGVLLVVAVSGASCGWQCELNFVDLEMKSGRRKVRRPPTLRINTKQI